MKENPIGIFDSGVGGLSVVKEIRKILPKEDIVYFGDTARVPYGTKSERIIKKFAEEDVKFLMRFKPKLIVIACHTVSSYAYEYLKKKFKNLRFINIIEPAVEKAIKISKNKKIGVIGTTATISSGRYQELLLKEDGIKVYTVSCPLFVPIVEVGLFEGKITKMIVSMYLNELKKKKIDTLILGCTHYPYLKKTIAEVMGEKVHIVDASYEVAIKTKEILDKNYLNNEKKCGKIKFYFSDIGIYTQKAILYLFGRKIKSNLVKNV